MKNVIWLPTSRAIDVPDTVAERNTADLAVVIPTYEERNNIEPLIAALDRALGGIRYELIFVDDWSQDGTADLVRAIARTRGDIRCISRLGRHGLSSAVVEGMLSTSADIIAVIDADMQHDESKLGGMFDMVARGEADIVVGSRYREGGGCGEWSAGRVKISRAATRLAQLALPRPISDPMSGFFVIRRDVAIMLAPKLSQKGFKILLDLLMSAPEPLRVREVSYVFRTREAGVSKLNARVMLSCLTMVLKKAAARWGPLRAVAFLIVGMLGLGVHLGVLWSAMFAGWSFAVAQVAAVAVAIAFNFSLNNAVTFSDRHLKGGRMLIGLASFYLVCGVGAAANVGVASAVFAAGHRWWLAGIAGALAGSVWNFAMSSRFTWRRGAAR